MEAIQIFEYGQSFRYTTDARTPEPGPGEVLIKVRASGLCSTDLHILGGIMDLGELPRIPGHEIAGDVTTLGHGVSRWEIGQRVTVALDVTCGQCRHCLSGQTQRCPNKQRIGFERDGGHAAYVTAPAKNLVPLPDNVGYEAASILPDAVACMYHSLIEQGKLGVNDRVVIQGVGGLGLHGVQIARLAGAQVLGTSRRAERLASAQRYGAMAVNPTVTDLPAAVAEFTDGEGADMVADCIGTQASIREGLALLRPGGKLLVIAYIDQEFIVPSIPLFSAEREIIGCRGSTRRDLEIVVDLISQDKLDPVIGASYPLRQISEAVNTLEAGEVVGRIVLQHE